MMNTPPPQVAVPQAVASPPAFGQATPNKKPSKPSMQPTFLGTGTSAQPGQLGQKTLLGA